MAFPDSVQTFVKAVDPSTNADIGNIAQYQQLISQGRFADAQSLLASMSNGIAMNLNAGRYNQVLETVVAIQHFLLDENGNYKTYLKDNISAFSDINLYNNTTNYSVGNVTSSGGKFFYCKQKNGPASKVIQPLVSAGWQNYWEIFVYNQEQYPIQKEQPSNQITGDLWFELIE